MLSLHFPAVLQRISERPPSCGPATLSPRMGRGPVSPSDAAWAWSSASLGASSPLLSPRASAP